MLNETQNTTNENDMTMQQLLDLYENSFQKFSEGEIVTGKVLSVSKDYVMVDVGYKSEGFISPDEFKNENNEVQVAVGDSIEVMIESWDEEEESVILSRDKAKKVKIWGDIKKIHDEEGIVEGTILNRVKGGFSVDIGLPAFLPGSQTDIKPIKNMDELVGQKTKFKILKYNQKRSNVVLSRRAILEEEMSKLREKTIAKLDIGQTAKGIVKNITDYGVFVDLGGIDGLLHITDISWGRIKNPDEKFSLGEEIEVKILAFDKESNKVSLGMKQLVDNPWLKAGDKYPIGERVQGKVVGLKEYGAFIELEEGIEGLIHVSEMSWTKKIKHPSKVVSTGDIVEAVILDINIDERRISLGMKQTTQNPWDLISEKYPVGTIIEGKVKNITDFGLFIGIEDDIDGLVHISDISWTKRIKHPSEMYQRGDVVQALVLEIDKENERFSLGIKQSQENPWKTITERYKTGSEIQGKITNVTEFGIFIELEEGIEGLIHSSEITEEKVQEPMSEYKGKIGEVITAKIMNVNGEERKIALSIKKVGKDEEIKEYEEYMTNLKEESAFSDTLADALEKQAEKEENK